MELFPNRGILSTGQSGRTGIFPRDSRLGLDRFKLRGFCGHPEKRHKSRRHMTKEKIRNMAITLENSVVMSWLIQP